MATPRFRVVRVPEDAEDGATLIAATPSLVERRYEDRKPWRCGNDNTRNEPEWRTCTYCGRWREDCEL